VTVEHEADPWAMQLVVMRDRHRPARQVDVCEAAARAVVSLLDDPRAAEGGPWFPAVKHWNDNRIRKLVRRADGKRWEDVQLLDGVTVGQDAPEPDGEFGPAVVRAFVPAPVRPLPKALDKLQVSGTHFPDVGTSASADAVVTIEINPGIEITTGKAAAQCGHAAQIAREEMDADALRRWREDGFRVRVVTGDRDSWRRNGRPVSITDAGFTELDGPTETTRAYW
jgi:peptidyl-tRNA hydrolase